MPMIGNVPADNNAYVQYLVDEMDKAHELVGGLSKQHITQIAKIVSRNYISGRAHRVMGETLSPASSLLEHPETAHIAPDLPMWIFSYLQKVISIYRQEAHRLHALAAGDLVAWETLSLWLVESAHYYLMRKGINHSAAAEMARDMAQQTCLRVYTSFFPCDVPFDTWVYVILKNQILQCFMRSRDLLDRQPYIESLDELQAELGDQPAATAIGHLLKQVGAPTLPNIQGLEETDWLLTAIAQMPSAERRAVIIYTYFHAYSDEEIALTLGKSTGAVHTLRHRALKQLQTILNTTVTLRLSLAGAPV